MGVYINVGHTSESRGVGLNTKRFGFARVHGIEV